MWTPEDGGRTPGELFTNPHADTAEVRDIDLLGSAIPETPIDPKDSAALADQLQKVTQTLNRLLEVSKDAQRAALRKPSEVPGLAAYQGSIMAELDRQSKVQSDGDIDVYETPTGLSIVDTRRTEPPPFMLDALCPLLWGKAKADYTNTTPIDWVTVYPCGDRLGNGLDTAVEITVYLMPGGLMDPNVRTDDIVGFMYDETGKAFAVTGYLDDPIGTVKMVITNPGSGTIAGLEYDDFQGGYRGWYLCDGEDQTTDMQGRLPCGACVDGSTDPDMEPGEFGGYNWHGADENDHSDHSYTTLSYEAGATETVVATSYTHSSTDNRPKFHAFLFIQRMN